MEACNELHLVDTTRPALMAKSLSGNLHATSTMDSMMVAASSAALRSFPYRGLEHEAERSTRVCVSVSVSRRCFERDGVIVYVA